jgi:hypothetical protein
MSGYTNSAIADHGILDPGTKLLHKPFSEEELVQKVRDVLDGDNLKPPDLGTAVPVLGGYRAGK